MTQDKLKLEADEIILAQVRKHWFILILNLFVVILGALLPLILYAGFFYGAHVSEIPMQLPENMTSISVGLYAGWLLIMWMAAFHIWTDYYLDVWTITNIRIIAIDQRGFFSRSMASFRLDRLQDVIVTVNGIIPTLLDYGAVEVQTAGEMTNFKARGLPHPGELKSIILHATDTLMAQRKVD
jgi:uncharacterized membrane protein YdbT with pleckstrin-like domain